MRPRVRELLIVALAVGWPVLAAAADDPTARGFDPDPTRPALSIDGGFAVETAAAAPRGAWQGALLLDYARDLLSLRLGDTRDALLESRLSAHLIGAWSSGRLEIAAHLPVALRQESDFSLLRDRGVTGALLDPVATTALGDLRLGAKLALLDEATAPVGVAALLDLRAPTGDRQAFTGDGPMAVPGAVATRRLGPVRLDAQAGYALRGRGQYAQLVVRDGLVYGVGASLDLPPLGAISRWRAIAELTGGWPRGNDTSTDRYRAPLSARAGLRAFLGRGLSVEVGGGAGLGEAGYGRERWRIFGGLRWTEWPRLLPADEDLDRDGLPNAKDLCPEQPGTAEHDGCPDRDADEIPDREDRCPDQRGPAENDGCPVGDEPLVEIESERLSLRDAIHFDTGKDTIRPESDKVIEAIAGLLRTHPELQRVRVEGHTDNVGGAAYNKDLSRRRAESVMRALVTRGIARDRLEAEGFGFEKPITSNATALGRAKNRRVEFTILSERG
jgi:OmpA-OmpF porin, OOP family